MHRRLGGVNDEVAEGEAKPPSLGALPQHHRLRAPPRKGPLQGRVVIWGRPISAARRRLWGQWGDVTFRGRCHTVPLRKPLLTSSPAA